MLYRHNDADALRIAIGCVRAAVRSLVRQISGTPLACRTTCPTCTARRNLWDPVIVPTGRTVVRTAQTDVFFQILEKVRREDGGQH